MALPVTVLSYVKFSFCFYVKTVLYKCSDGLSSDGRGLAPWVSLGEI